MNPMAQKCPSLALCGYYELQLLFYWNITHYHFTFLNHKPRIKKNLFYKTLALLKLPELMGKGKIDL